MFKNFVCMALAAVAVFGFSTLGYCVGEDAITIQTLDVAPFTDAATSIWTTLKPVIFAAGGLGLSIWVITMVFRKFKSMGR